MHGRLGTLSALMIAFSFLLCGAAIWLRLGIPEEQDLYNLIYDNSRPNKPENSTFFLLVFPSFAVAGSILFALSSKKGAGLKILFPVAVWSFFAIAAIVRFVVVTRFYQA